MFPWEGLHGTVEGHAEHGGAGMPCPNCCSDIPEDGSALHDGGIRARLEARRRSDGEGVVSGEMSGGYRYPDSEDEYDPAPGYYCCLNPSCAHDRDQVFNGGGGQ